MIIVLLKGKFHTYETREDALKFFKSPSGQEDAKTYDLIVHQLNLGLKFVTDTKRL